MCKYRTTCYFLLASYLLAMVVFYVPHSHEHPVVLESQPYKTTHTKSHSHNHHHSHSHTHSPADQKQNSHQHQHGSDHHSSDDCLLCQFQMQSQDQVAIVTLPPTSYCVTTLTIVLPLAIYPPLLGISQSRAPPVV